MSEVVVTGSFDDLRSRDIRFLEEASKLGNLHVLMWPDKLIKSFTGIEPKFDQDERLYMLDAIRYVDSVTIVSDKGDPCLLPEFAGIRHQIWAVDEQSDNPNKSKYCQAHNLQYLVTIQ